MKTITGTELKNILEQHKLWIDGKGGKCANLEYANLNRANLTGADLRAAILTGAILTGAILTGAILTGANLYCAILRDANLTGANLYRANLTGADLTGADLYRANLTGTILDKDKEEKQPEVSPCKVENVAGTRQALEKLAKEHGFKIVSLGLELL